MIYNNDMEEQYKKYIEIIFSWGDEKVRTLKQASDQAAFCIKEMGYTVISESIDVGYYLMTKVDIKHGDIHLLEITKDQENPTCILMNKTELDIINKMFVPSK